MKNADEGSAALSAAVNPKMKRCFKCLATKPLCEFYAHKEMADGHLNKCKACAKLDVTMRYQDPEARQRIDAYEKARFQQPERKKKILIYQQTRRHRNPEKYKARSAVANAVRAGKLKRLPCEKCGDPKVQAHHSDYRYPLAVRWLCFKHHRQLGHKQSVTS